MKTKMLRRIISVICAVGISASCATGLVGAVGENNKKGGKVVATGAISKQKRVELEKKPKNKKKVADKKKAVKRVEKKVGNSSAFSKKEELKKIIKREQEVKKLISDNIKTDEAVKKKMADEIRKKNDKLDSAKKKFEEEIMERKKKIEKQEKIRIEKLKKKMDEKNKQLEDWRCDKNYDLIQKRMKEFRDLCKYYDKVKSKMDSERLELLGKLGNKSDRINLLEKMQQSASKKKSNCCENDKSFDLLIKQLDLAAKN